MIRSLVPHVHAPAPVRTPAPEALGVMRGGGRGGRGFPGHGFPGFQRAFFPQQVFYRTPQYYPYPVYQQVQSQQACDVRVNLAATEIEALFRGTADTYLRIPGTNQCGQAVTVIVRRSGAAPSSVAGLAGHVLAEPAYATEPQYAPQAFGEVIGEAPFSEYEAR